MRLNKIFITLTFVAELLSTRVGFAQMTGKWGDQGDDTYRNPIIAADYSDPDPIRVGEDYYMVTSTFESSPGVSILHSRDLVNWTTVGAALMDLEKFSSAFSHKEMKRYNGGVYAPTISYHEGKFYIYVNLVNDGFVVCIADSPEGAWESRLVEDKYGRPLRVSHWTDPCPFWDEDGKAYLVASHPCKDYWFSYLFEMSPDGGRLLDADATHMAKHNIQYEYPLGGTVISPYHSSEGNRIFKRDGYYYLQHIEFLDRGHGEGTYLFRSKYLYGTHPDGTPGTPGNPGVYETMAFDCKQSDGRQRLPGQGGYVDTPDGRWFWVGQFNQYWQCGRAPHLLPVEWISGWPVAGDVTDGSMEGKMIWQMAKPIQGYDRTLPLGSDDFNTWELSPKWCWNHASDSSKWSLIERPGWLRLHGAPTAGRRGFFGARNTLNQHYMQGDSVVAEIKMDITGMKGEQKSGLAHFNGGKNYAFIAVADSKDGICIEYCHDGNYDVIARLPKKCKTVWLRTTSNFDCNATFQYSTDGKHYHDAGHLYPLTAANFRGDMIGIFTFDETDSDGHVDIDYFNYSVTNR